MSVAAVKPELIRWARERAGLTRDALGKRFPKFVAWERGEANPTLRQLEDLARRTFTPLGYFFLAEPPEDRLPIPDFRTLKDQPVLRPSPNLLETVQMMQRRQNWMRDFLIEEGEDPLPFVGSVTLRGNAVTVAANMRQVLGLKEDWAREESTWTNAMQVLRETVDKAGILIVLNGVVGNNTHRKLDPEEFRGFILEDKFAPLIFVNGTDFKAAQMFTIAHELVHVWLGRGGVFNLQALAPADDDVEKFCNRVAAEFLIPEVEIRASSREAERTAEPFQTLARRFKVSPLVAARRAFDLGLISRKRFFDFYEEYQEDDRRKSAKKSDGGDFYNTQNVRVGKRFAHAVIRAAQEGRLLYRDAYQLTGLHGKTFDQYAKELGYKVD